MSTTTRHDPIAAPGAGRADGLVDHGNAAFRYVAAAVRYL